MAVNMSHCQFFNTTAGLIEINTELEEIENAQEYYDNLSEEKQFELLDLANNCNLFLEFVREIEAKAD